MYKKFYHKRYLDGSAVTTCNLEADNGKLLATGMAICSPKDNFSRERGRIIAEGRAMKAFELKTSFGEIRQRNFAEMNYARNLHAGEFKGKAIGG